LFIRIIFALTLLLTTLFSAEIDIHAKLMPRIVLQSSLANQSDSINIAIAYTPKLVYRAVKLKKLIATSVKGRVINTTLLDVTKNYSLKNFQALYLSDLDGKIIDELIKKSKENKIITFGKDLKQFKKGAIFFIESKRKINIYLNTKFANDANIGFNPSLLKYVKHHD